MAVLCPHCRTEPIPFGERLGASYARPVICYRCTGVSLQKCSRSSGFALYSLAVVFVCVVSFGLVFLPLEWALGAFAALVAVAIVVVVLDKLLCPLHPLTGEQLRMGRLVESRRKRSFVAAALFLFLVASVLRFGGV